MTDNAIFQLCSFYFCLLCDWSALTQDKGTSFYVQIMSTVVDLLQMAGGYDSGTTSLQQHELLRAWAKDATFWDDELMPVLPDQNVRNPNAVSPTGESTIDVCLAILYSLEPQNDVFGTAIDRLLLFQCFFNIVAQLVCSARQDIQAYVQEGALSEAQA